MYLKSLKASAALALIFAATPAFSKPATKAHAAKATAKPQLGAFGVDTAGMDRAVKPGDDFYKFANGNWDKTTEIPADKSTWGSFGILRDLSDKRTRTIIEGVAAAKSAPGSVSQKVGDYYASFMDEAGIEAKGLAPLQPLLTQISAIQTPSQIAAAMAFGSRTGMDVPIGIGVGQDLKDNSVYTAYAGQGGLGLPDRDYYLEDKPSFVEIRTKYVAHIGKMLALAGVAESAAKAQRIYDLEKKIAASHWTQAESRQVEKLYNAVPAAELSTRMPGFDWPLYLQVAGLAGQKTVIVTQPSALTAAAKLVSSEPLETWKDYLTFHIISGAADYLPKAFVEEDFAFKGRVLAGTPALKERWKRGVDQVNASLGEAVGELYVAQYFKPEAKAKADMLVKNLLAAMDARLAKLAWMSPDTKGKARVKLAAFTAKIGYPDKWRDYGALEVKSGDPLGNALRAAGFEYDRQLNKIGKPVDRSEWGMTPQTVNAYANPPLNEIVFPAAILQPPFFDPDADPAVNYGGIGMVIGHEISHHFDDQGRKFDPKGNFADWWTAEDVKRFQAYTAKVVAQYGAYEPLKGSKINGELTLGENMADLAGLNVALDAYHLSLGGKPAPVIGGYTGDQRFFLGFGQVWRTKMRDSALLAQLTSNEHSPGQFRPYVVRNLDAWYSAFGAKLGEKLYLAPADRIKVW